MDMTDKELVECTNDRHGKEAPLANWEVGDSTEGFCNGCLKMTKQLEAIKKHVEKNGINPIGDGSHFKSMLPQEPPKTTDGLIYAPGQFDCPKCNFHLVSNNLNMVSGTVSAKEPGDRETCPNCPNTFMEPTTWKAYAKTLEDRFEEAIEIGKRQAKFEMSHPQEPTAPQEGLLPCPFCGGIKITIDLKYISGSGDGNFGSSACEGYKTRCEDCGANGSYINRNFLREWMNPHPHVPGRTEETYKKYDQEQKEKAIKSWNRRAFHRGGMSNQPTIICLCGSTRFMEAFQAANLKFTLMGFIVLSVGCNTKSDSDLKITEGMKAQLDELHKRKIDLAQEVFVLNVGGYIGESTRSEIEYAKKHGKVIHYLEPVASADRDLRSIHIDRKEIKWNTN